jgi:hypothetical protein
MVFCNISLFDRMWQRTLWSTVTDAVSMEREGGTSHVRGSYTVLITDLSSQLQESQGRGGGGVSLRHENDCVMFIEAAVQYEILFAVLKLSGVSPRANYTDQAKLVPTFADRGCHVVSVTDAHGRILGLLDRSHYLFFQVAPQLYSRGWKDPVPDPLLLRKCASARNRTRTFGSVAMELWSLDHRDDQFGLAIGFIGLSDTQLVMTF